MSLTITVQQPQRPWPQLSRAPYRSNRLNSSTRFSWVWTSISVLLPFSTKLIDLACGFISISDRISGLEANASQHALRSQRQGGQANADRIVNRVGDRRRNAESRAFSDAFGAERSAALLGEYDVVLDVGRNIVDAGDLVIGERGVGDLTRVKLHVLEHRKAKLHDRGAGQLRFHDVGVEGPSHVGGIDKLGQLHMTGFGINLDLDASTANHPERRDVVGHAGNGIGRFVGWDEAADPHHVAGLHAVFLLENLASLKI